MEPKSKSIAGLGGEVRFSDGGLCARPRGEHCFCERKGVNYCRCWTAIRIGRTLRACVRSILTSSALTGRSAEVLDCREVRGEMRLPMQAPECLVQTSSQSIKASLSPLHINNPRLGLPDSGAISAQSPCITSLHPFPQSDQPPYPVERGRGANKVLPASLVSTGTMRLAESRSVIRIETETEAYFFPPHQSKRR